MSTVNRHSTEQKLRDEIAELRARLAVAEETLRAVRGGGVNGCAPEGEQTIAPNGVAPSDRLRGGRVAERERYNFRLLFEHAVDGIFIADAQGRYVDVNIAACAMLGCTREELLSLKPADIVAPEEIPRIGPEIARLAGGQVVKSEWRFRRKDGSILIGELTGQPLPGGRLHATVRDVTAQRQAADALRQTEHFLQRITTVMPGVIQIFDLVEKRSVLINGSVASLLGYTPEEIEAMGSDVVPTLMHPEDLARLPEHMARLHTLSDDAFADFEHRMRDRAGQWHWFHSRDAVFQRDATGGVRQIIGTALEITERKRAEVALARARDQLQTTIESITDGLLVMDREWRYTFFSKQAAKIVGVRQEDMLGKIVWDLFPQAKGTKFYESYHRAVDTQQVQRFEEFYPEPLNQWLECHCYPSAEGLTVYFHDVTARNLAQEQISRSQKLLSEVVERAPFGIYVVDSQFRIAHMNSGSQEGAFRNIRPVIGSDFSEAIHMLWPSDVAEEVIAHFRHTLDTGEPYYAPQFIRLRADAAEIVEAYEWELHRLMLPEGRFGVICYYFDSTKLRQAEVALRQSDARLVAVTENLTEAIMIADAEGRVIHWNPAALAMLGYASMDECRRKLAEFADTYEFRPLDDDRPVPLAGWPMSRVLRGEMLRDHEIRIRRLDQGWEKIVSVSGSLIRSASGEMLAFLSLTDITERRKVQEALELTQASVDGAAELVVWFTNDGRVYYTNEATCRMLGYSREELLQMTALDFSPGFTWEQYAEHWQEIRRRKSFILEVVHRRKDGTEYPAEVLVNHVEYGSREFIFAYGRNIAARKAAEAAVRESEAGLQTFLDTAATGLVRNSRDMRYRAVNVAYAKLVGRPVDQILGRTLGEVLGERAMDNVRPHVERVLRGERVEYEAELHFQGTGPRWVEVTYVPDRDASGEIIGWVGSIHDIAERKRAEESLRAAYDTFRHLVEQSPFGVYAVDADFRLVQVSVGAQKFFEKVRPLLGRDFEEVLRTVWAEPFASEAIGHFRHTLGTGEPYHAPNSVERRADIGAVESYDWKIERTTLPDGRFGVVCHFYDLSERQRYEAALRASDLRTRLATEATGVGIWEWNIITNQIRWDPEMFRIYGIAPTEDGFVVYATWVAAVVAEELGEQERVLQDFVRTGGLSTREFRIVRASDGECRDIRAVETVRKNAEGKAEWVVGTNLDITERKRAIEALRAAKEQAEAANRAKDHFLAVLSHELRTPLTPVLMAASSLMDDPDLRLEVREDLAMMKRNIELETKLIDDLLDLSRVTSGKLALTLAPVDLNDAVRHACGICRSAIDGRNLRFEMEFDPDVGRVVADSARLKQVFWNVVSNAIKFTSHGGLVRVSTRRVGPARCEVRIEDSGRGIPFEALPRIFNAFEQGGPSTARLFGGLGLGLAISEALVTLHGGVIRAESAGLGHGSTFIIELPRDSSATAAHAPVAAPQAQAGGASIRVLLTEDHADTSRVLSQLLRRAGFTVTTAGDVATAIETAAREPVDVLVSDLGLPDASGCDLMRHVRASRRLPGIAMSGFGTDDDMRQSREAGFAEHLVKPIDVAQLIAAIRRVVPNPQ